MAGPTTDDGVRRLLSEPGWDGWVMFVGVVDVRDTDPIPHQSSIGVTVERVHRGSVPERVVIRDTGDGGSCGHNPASGSREFIIAREAEGDAYEATYCGTVPFGAGQAQFFDALDRVSRGYAPTQPDGGGGALWPALGFLAAATAAGAIALTFGYSRGRTTRVA
jgi:hypothetical protein